MSYPVSLYDVITGHITAVAELSDDTYAMYVDSGYPMVTGMFDPSTHYIEAGQIKNKPTRPSKQHQFDYASKTWIDPRTLNDLKASKWAEVKAARDKTEFAGFIWDGSLFDSDPLSQQRISGSAQAAQIMGTTFATNWTLADNTTRTLDADQMIAVGLTMLAHIDACHTRGRLLRMQINEADTMEKLATIVW